MTSESYDNEVIDPRAFDEAVIRTPTVPLTYNGRCIGTATFITDATSSDVEDS